MAGIKTMITDFYALERLLIKKGIINSMELAEEEKKLNDEIEEKRFKAKSPQSED